MQSGRPCDNCVKRNQSNTCIYPNFAKRGHNRPAKVQERINRLETMFLDLYDKTETSISSDGEQAVKEPSPVERQNTVTSASVNDVSNIKLPTKWEAILEDITEIKDYFEEHDHFLKHDIERLQISKGQPRPGDFVSDIGCEQGLSALLSYLPERSSADRLVATYFEMGAFFRPVVHPKQFQREYSQFWKSPSTVSRSWLGLLFAILRLSAHTSRQFPNNTSPTVANVDETVSRLRRAALQCLTFEDYARADSHLLQGLLTHLEAEYLQSLDPQPNFYVLTGTTVRVALMIGLHRDPSHDPNLTPLESEIRRRLWLCIVHCDILLSFQMGLPAMIPHGQVDTKLPRNLGEEDFDEDTKILPESRPIDGTTTIAFYLAKAPIIEILGRIASHQQDVHSDDDAVAKLDADLRAARARVPPYYRVRPIEDCLIDPSIIIMRRYAVDQIALTAQCILHRKGLVAARFDKTHAPSRKACIDAAMTLLDYQKVRHRETQPGGCLPGLRGTMVSITKNDWLLSAMLVCLDIHLSMTKRTGLSDDMVLWGRDRSEEMIQALETSYHIWKESSEESVEALKASEALAAMLMKIRPESGITTRYSWLGAFSESAGGTADSDVLNAPQSDNLSLSAMSGQLQDTSNPNPSATAPFTQIFVDPETIDWSELDRYFINSVPPPVSNTMDLSDDWLDNDIWTGT